MTSGRSGHVDPPTWDSARLRADADRATAEFREARTTEPLEEYLERFEDCRDAFDELLEQTVDLAQLGDHAVAILTDKRLCEALRYLAGPPISLDDLKTLVDSSISLKQVKADPTLAQRVIEVVLLGLDRRRFPWMTPSDRRPATDAERAAAVLASAALLATRQVETARRNEGKTAQEERVKQALRDKGFTEVPPCNVPNLAQAPGPGTFCGECQFGSRKADVLVRLWDGRVMPIECKVTNSSTNSIKRLNNDAAVKASTWIQEFGTRSVVPSALLSGVLKLRNLEDAQARGLTLWWAHDLDAMMNWIESTRPS